MSEQPSLFEQTTSIPDPEPYSISADAITQLLIHYGEEWRIEADGACCRACRKAIARGRTGTGG